MLAAYFKDLRGYRRLGSGAFALSLNDLKPRISDKTADTPVDPVYFYQDSWCARKIFVARPKRHYDIGSKAEMVGIISQFTPTTMVDIRPIGLEMPGLSFEKGSILDLPFEDGSIHSLSSICVIEHIGLGRYGDPLDPRGSERAAAELIRVLAPEGDLYVSVPVDDSNKTYFNAHRAFTRDYALKIFSGLRLIEERYIYGRALENAYDPTKGFGTGMYHFKKPL